MSVRARQLSQARNTLFDLMVVGGGITGCGVARDAALRGLRVLLVDQGDIGKGTSSRSSKLVHGGLRYLEHGQIGLVFESVSERRVLMGIAPHLVKPLPFLFPVYKKHRRSPLVLDIGMWLYDGLSLFRSPRMHRRLSSSDVAQEEPSLDREGLKAAELYYDCGTDDARLTLETALDAQAHGATVLPWCRVEAFVMGSMGRLRGARLKDRLEGDSFDVTASAIVNATGPWTDQTTCLEGRVGPRLLRPTKGVHIVVDHRRLPLRYANVMVHPRDGRVMFAIPWGERTYLGTTDTDWQGDPDEVAATRSDVDYILEAASESFPDRRLVPKDVIATWAGLRPLLSEDGVAESSVSREHRVVVDRDGLITVAGGKLTTYRKMSAEVVDRVQDLFRVANIPGALVDHAPTALEALPGAVGWPEGEPEVPGEPRESPSTPTRLATSIQEQTHGLLTPESCVLLANSYGMHGRDIAGLALAEPLLAAQLVPGRPEILAQVDWAVKRELALTLEDFLIRRSSLFFKDLDQGLGCAELVSTQMALLLNWTEERRQTELERYRKEVARSRAWREEQF